MNFIHQCYFVIYGFYAKMVPLTKKTIRSVSLLIALSVFGYVYGLTSIAMLLVTGDTGYRNLLPYYIVLGIVLSLISIVYFEKAGNHLLSLPPTDICKPLAMLYLVVSLASVIVFSLEGILKL
jgi:hypothetical protein